MSSSFLEALTLQAAEAAILENRLNAPSVLRNILRQYVIQSDIETLVIGMTAELAQFLLKLNYTFNRKVSQKTVKSYARQMTRGQFLNTGEALLFSAYMGYGYDLQHRLQAVILANESIPGIVVKMTITFNIPCESLDEFKRLLYMSQQAKQRTKTDSTAILINSKSVPEGKLALAICETIQWYILPDDVETGTIESSISKLDIAEQYENNYDKYSNIFTTVAALYNRYMSHFLIDGTLPEDQKINDLTKSRLPFYAAAYLKMLDIDAEQAHRFMDAWFSTENTLHRYNAIDALRSLVLSRKGTGLRDGLRPVHIRTAMMKAFSYFITNTNRMVWLPEAFGLKRNDEAENAPVIDIKPPSNPNPKGKGKAVKTMVAAA